jgi:hypothetical protein
MPLVQSAPAAALVGWVRACGVVLAHAGSAERAARLLGHEEFLRERHTLSIDATDRRELDDAMKLLNDRLYPAVLASAWEHGRRMTLQDAIAEVSIELQDQQARRA